MAEILFFLFDLVAIGAWAALLALLCVLIWKIIKEEFEDGT